MSDSLEHNNSDNLSQFKRYVKKRQTNMIRHLLCTNRGVTKLQINDYHLMHRLFYNVNSNIQEQVSIIKIMELLLNLGADINNQNSLGYTVLHMAIDNRMKLVIDFLLSCNVKLDVRDEYGNPLVHFLIERESNWLEKQLGSSNCKRGLLSIFVDGSQEEFNKQYEKQQRAEQESVEFIRWMILKGLDVDCKNIYGDTAVHYVMKMEKEQFFNVIVEHSKDVNAVDKNGNTPLDIVMNFDYDVHYDKELVDMLLSKGADVHRLKKDGYSSMIIAVMNRKLDLLKIFKEHGVDFCHNYRDGNLLHYFFKSNYCREEIILDLLIDQGCDVNARNNQGFTPLHFAARRIDPKLVNRLIDCGADVNNRDFICQYTPLHVAAEYNNDKIIMTLIKRGADVNAKTKKGRTPLHLLKIDLEETIGFPSLNEKVKKCMIETLISYGACINIKDNAGFLPLQAAILRGDNTKIKQLLKFGADINDNSHVFIFKDYDVCLETVKEHLIKLQVAKLPINPNMIGLLKFNPRYVKIKEKCLIEIKRLKNYKININTSVYDLLHMNRNFICSFIENQQLEEFIKSPITQERFPMYYNLILSTHYMAIERRKMLEPAKRAWFELTGIRLPDVCVYEILNYLGNSSLRGIVEGTRYIK